MTAADILDVTKSGGDIAVNLAIGESQVIMENKEYFALHGVDIDALESAHSSAKAQKRSSTTLLVKNLPPRADASELESMFARFGALGAFLLPPSKTLALADFVEPSEARAAFKGLAYRSYKHAPLYLEWAPVDVIDKNKLKKAMSNQNKQQKQQQQQQQQAQRSGAAAAAAEGDDDDDDDAIYSSVFIKNLNFSTTDQNLRDHIVRIGAGEGLRTAVIRKKTKEASSGSGSGGAVSLSQGFGFAEYSSHALAARAVQLLHGSVLDMHTLEVKPSDKRLTAPPATATGKSKGNGAFQHTTTNSNSSSNASSGAAAASEHTDAKVIVRNVAFQATKSEIRNLFAAYSSVRRVRIPKKMNGEHRGFAFVDFSSSREAEAAIAALKNAHLYGRHLVIEWAKSDDDGQHEDIEQLRKKARRSEKSFAPSSLHEQF